MAQRLAQIAFTGGEVAPQSFARTDIGDGNRYNLSLKAAQNVIINKLGGAANRPGTSFVCEVKDSSKTHRLLSFQFSTDQNYVLDWGDETMRPIKDGGAVLSTATNITGITQASPGVVTAVSHGLSAGDHVYIQSVGGMTQMNSRFFLVSTVPTANTLTLTDMYGTAVNTTSYTAYTSGGTIARLYQMVSPYDHTELAALNFAQEVDTGYLAHRSYAPRKLTRSGHASWTITTVTFGPTLAAPTSPSATNSVGSGATTYSYKATAIDDDTGEESLPSSVASTTNDLTVAGNYNTFSWSSVTGAERYIVYKAENGVYGFIGGTTGLSFVDDNISPDLGDTPPEQRNPFSSTDNYPGVVGFHEGRLGWARTNNEPSGVWFSQSNIYENLNVSAPAKADDAVTLRLRPGVNAVTGMISQKDGLVVLTKEQEYLVTGGGVTEYISPASVFPRKQTRRGAAEQPSPIDIGDIVLYVQRQGTVIRAFGYSFERDGYRGNDLTLLAPHLFRGKTIVDWCYQQDPNSILWVVLSDGSCVTLTYVEEQNVFAWTRQVFGGVFSSGDPVVESCACIEGTDGDEVYLLIKRTINSQTKRYIEKVSQRWDNESDDIEDAFFVDCGATYSGSAATTITGLHHLEGQSVVALADGNYVAAQTVTSGAITLALAASTVHVGLSYTAEIEQLPLQIEGPRGAVNAVRRSVSGVVLKLDGTRGIEVGIRSRASDLVEVTQRQAEAWSDPMDPYTGDTRLIKIAGGWGDEGLVYIRQTKPLPMEVTAIYRDVDIGGQG